MSLRRPRLTLVGAGSEAPDDDGLGAAPFQGRHILAVAEGDAGDDRVLAQARLLARLSGASLTVLAVAGRRSTRDAAWRERVRAIAGPVRAWARGEGLKSTAMTLGGDPCRAILDVASERGVDLIVMAASSGRFLAGLPGRVAALAACPVMTVSR